ncbi:hypothetical protein A2W67_00115 [Candidatus Nomurabacteria bacterium RIFCSPLOWO2_02_40_28]|uniref:DUF4357 domain-containing protein n=2 Tax=Candidatus Nomuraibacteriota TaxID=1752729 RepID=A0A837HTW5_9BACT|nr:MAG: hypothetical protein UT27_C0009G0005 [Candidatus Nomurabacteria bacterium GW2011_GWD2_39_12]KKR20211.1 MAG: hypothetical protein UT51_C0006G0005 [Candidatus Nomurabacteria bacterium GW2011_GWC2_39_41]KKR36667.1 MAG: hypothetical protein UT70_C0007G0005 [Candidatus Nomurabacteria bacterium GW2011_GWE2_40_10]KKR38108.1 MAG: hypothetical protein UT73_C0006G0005 [Candidatus Nomurabacteria bacterium GW2011_GWB1_40_11]KKR39712.1 MAG: hypothetical protein UT74_C0006G0005 [Parcubacteria group b
MARVITVILLDDNPEGLRLIEMDTWSGKAFVVPRTKLKDFRQREDAQQPGLYFLFGEGDEHPKAYIGQSENVVDRLFSHDANREIDEWNTALVFVGKLDAALIKYLESVSLSLAKRANRYEVFNSTIPKENKLSEAQKITVSDYFDRVRSITGLFGYKLFDEIVNKKSSVTYHFEDVKNKDGSGKGTISDTNEFVVFKGSLARIEQTKSFGGSGPRLRSRLIEDGILKKINDKSYIFTQDHIFTSPSAASDTIAGRSTNGWGAWKDDKGNTLDENLRK